MPALGAHDAHGGPGRSQEEAGRFGLPRIPSYEASFRSFSQRVILRAPFTGNAAADEATLVEALRAGRTYTTLDAVAGPAWLEFAGQRGGQTVEMGEKLPGDGQGTLIVRAPVAVGSAVTLLHNGRTIAESSSGKVSAPTRGPGAYRVEVRLSNRRAQAPWILSNPIYVDLPSTTPTQSQPEFTESVSLEHAEWHVEHDPSSTATVLSDDQVPGIAFELGRNAVSPFAALVAAVPRPVAPFDAVSLDVTSQAPARISVQFRSNDGSARWRKSVYVGPQTERVLLRTSDFVPVEKGGPDFDAAEAGAILLVVDLVNSLPGSSGRLVVHHLSLARIR
jgi:hypothetical protein